MYLGTTHMVGMLLHGSYVKTKTPPTPTPDHFVNWRFKGLSLTQTYNTNISNPDPYIRPIYQTYIPDLTQT